MTFYNGEPFWIEYYTNSKTSRNCPCGKRISKGDRVAICGWEGAQGNWTTFHPECAMHHPMNEDNLAKQLDNPIAEEPPLFDLPDLYAWHEGTQRDMIIFGQDHEGQPCEFRYDRHAPRGKQWSYRLRPGDIQ